MASRPFSSVCVEVEKKGDPAAGGGVPERKELKDHVDTALRRRKKVGMLCCCFLHLSSSPCLLKGVVFLTSVVLCGSQMIFHFFI